MQLMGLALPQQSDSVPDWNRGFRFKNFPFLPSRAMMEIRKEGTVGGGVFMAVASMIAMGAAALPFVFGCFPEQD